MDLRIGTLALSVSFFLTQMSVWQFYRVSPILISTKIAHFLEKVKWADGVAKPLRERGNMLNSRLNQGK